MASSGTTKNRRKLALVVGINEYDEFPSLRCSENDAKDMASALKRIGFEVTVKLGVNHKEMEHAIVDFKDSIEKGDIVVLFFAGHGVQWRGQNYLIMKNTQKKSPESLEERALDAKELLDKIGNKRPYVNIFFLDCCQSPVLSFNTNNGKGERGNPKELKGLASMDRAGSLIAFACMPGTTAKEITNGRNGLFTKYLLEEIVKPNRDIFSILTEVTDLVKNDPTSDQIPYLSSSLAEPIILNDTIIGSAPDGIRLINHRNIQDKRKIGVGGFGVVYHCQWETREVALKELHLQRLDDDIEKEFKREFKMLSELKHPNVVELLGACMEPGHYALVMEFMNLGSLYQILHKEKKQLESPTRLSIALQAAQAIDYLHSLTPPVVHQDIKSPNFLLSGSLSKITVKICDFGLAKARNETTRQTGAIRGVIGSLPWTAPEILEMNDYTTNSDIYSLAMVYWEISTYKIPYDGKRDENIRVFVLSKSRLKLPAETPSSLARVIEKCWAHDPKDRLTCKEIIKMLNSTGQKEFADPGQFKELFCKGRLCARCGLCRDWYFTGDQQTWSWVQRWNDWKDDDWERYFDRNNGAWRLWKKREDGATCDRGGHHRGDGGHHGGDRFGHYYLRYGGLDRFGHDYLRGDVRCVCADNHRP